MRSSEGAADRVESHVVERRSHDPRRPVVSTATAAAALATTRPAIRRAIDNGDLAGYFTRGPQRRRYWVYADALPGAPAAPRAGPDRPDEAAETSRLLAVLLTALDEDEPATEELRAQARRLLDEAARHRSRARRLEDEADEAEARANRLFEEATELSRRSALREAIRQAVLPAHAGRWEGGRGDPGS